MSDGAAEVVAAPEAATANEGTKQPEGTAPPKPRTIDDDLEDVLKKHGGYSYKAAGKERKVEKAADLKRMLSRVDGLDAATSETLKTKQANEEFRSRISQIEKLPKHERLKALESLGVKPSVIREALEDNIVEEDSRERALAAMTPRERQTFLEKERLEEENRGFRARQQQAEEEERHNQHAARVNEIGQRLEKVTVGALKALKIAPSHVPHFMEPIARELDRAERLGLDVSEEDIAGVVMKEQEEMADRFYGGLDIPGLADKLEGIEVDDPSRPGRKTTRAKLLMLEYAKRVRAQQSGAPAPVVRAPAPAQQQGEESREEKIRKARTFGGGWG